MSDGLGCAVTTRKAVSQREMIPTRVLIKLVQARGCLWDSSHPMYRDSRAKRSAWYEIFREVEPAYETLRPDRKKFIRHSITKKWYNPRESYVKFLRLGKHSKPYVHSDQLEFLDAMYLGNSGPRSFKQRESRGGSEETGAIDDEQNFERVMDTDSLDAENTEIKSNSLEAEMPRLKYAREISTVSVLVHLLQKEEDEDRAFFSSITPAVKTLSTSSKLKFRMQVLKLINNYKMKDPALTLKVERVSDVESETE